jgi:molybdopterin molybdotransferase
VSACGGEPLRLGTAPDEPQALRGLLQAGLDEADVLLTIGGISKGTHDLVHDLLLELGVTAEFHGIQLKPGKPTFFGHRRGDRRTAFVFGLPGNPASAFTVFDLLVRPLLLRLQGASAAPWRASARLAGARYKTNPRLQAVPASLAADGGVLTAVLLRPSPSGDPFALLGANAYALLPGGTAAAAESTVTVVPGGAGIHFA